MPLVSSVAVLLAPKGGWHDRVRIWNRGGLAGELIVGAGDGPKLAARLLPDAADVVVTEREGSIERRVNGF